MEGFDADPLRGPRLGDDVCISEEVKISIHSAIDNFRADNSKMVLTFPSSLTATERAYIHRYCQSLSMKTKSKGAPGKGRCITVSKKDKDVSSIRCKSLISLSKSGRQQIINMLKRYPLSQKEKQELVPRTEKCQQNNAIKEVNKTTVGKLHSGVAQVPPMKGQSELQDFARNLPIDQYKEDILHMIETNRVCLISGETGSGKTTQVPQFILDHCALTGNQCRIFCTQPRRIAALSVSERVAAERGEMIGQSVGYQIRLESKVSPKTVLTFCTTGVLLRTLMGGDSGFAHVSHVIVDEVHERDRFTDFLLGAVKDLLIKFSHLKVILMSATLNTELFTRFFNNCPHINIPGTLFPVEELFLEDVLKLTGFTNKKMEKIKKAQKNVSEKQAHISEWCSKVSPGDDETATLEENLKANLSLDVPYVTEEEEEEIPEDLVKEMDYLLGEVWLTGNEDLFSQIVHLIVSENISVDYQHSETSATALMIASGRGFPNTVEQLLSLGANVNVHAYNQWTAIDWAKKFNHSDIVDILEANFYSNHTGPDGDNVSSEAISSALTEEEKALVTLYQHSFDDEKVDCQLILALIHKILDTSSEGALLVFLPGYDEIVELRDRINDDKIVQQQRYVMFTLHSSMQSSDQKKVFKAPPPGVRKIILSTNIAETSITIDDVVFVIDSGKVKEKLFDALLSVTMLKSTWVSKAAAKQRKGRAGRCRPGVCYHLFSKARYLRMEEFPVPEILKYPIQELCLHTKLIAPSGCSIADYLSHVPKPPPALLTQNAVQFLQQIEALDKFEDLTELGLHISDLPIDPSLGKMVIYSVVLKCLDPILTIVCALAYKDPFLLPAHPSQKREVQRIRVQYSANTHSDHMSLLRVFQSWQKARTDGYERKFCSENFISSACMEMIVGTRTQLLGQLRASGFVRARGSGDIRDLNSNAENWAVIKACLCAGSYPCLLKRDGPKKVPFLVSQKETNVRFHVSSVLNASSNPHSNNKLLLSDWLIYQEMSRYRHFPMVKCCTVVSPLTVLLFAGPIKLPASSFKDPQDEKGEANEDNAAIGSDSEDEDEHDKLQPSLHLDDWLGFKLDHEVAGLVLQLRQKWNSLFLRRLRAPAKPWTEPDEAVIQALIQVLASEEHRLGLQQPAGIGQRPRPMTAESIMEGNSVQGNYKIEENNELKFISPSAVGSKNQQTSPSYNRIQQKEGQRAGQSCHYFVIKPPSHRQLDIMCASNTVCTSARNASRFFRAFKDCEHVYFIFFVQGSGHIQGYAEMMELPSDDGSISIEWMMRSNVPIRQLQHLRNRYNENKPIHASKDGQEIDPAVAEQLLYILESTPSQPEGRDSYCGQYPGALGGDDHRHGSVGQAMPATGTGFHGDGDVCHHHHQQQQQHQQHFFPQNPGTGAGRPNMGQRRDHPEERNWRSGAGFNQYSRQGGYGFPKYDRH